MALRSVNLSVSSACGADCVFCPSDRGTRIHAKNMPLQMATKVIDELTAPWYRDVKYVQIGENGDCFLNRAAIDILRYIKMVRPDIAVCVFTDAQSFTEEKIEIVMREGLLAYVGVNVDGATPESFRAAKRLSDKYVWKFLPTFIEMREKYQAGTQLEVWSLTARHYIDAVRVHLGHDPIRITDPAQLEIEDDFEAIKARVEPVLRNGDRFHRSTPMFWAERAGTDPTKLNYSKYTCPLTWRVQTEAFIAPDGSWYSCCFDSNNETVFGNVFESSLRAVEQSEARQTFLRRLANKQFGEIGGACASVDCCQFGISEPIKKSEGASLRPPIPSQALPSRA